MTTTLSRSARQYDWVLSRSLRENYIDPFVRIDRMDGIVVPDEYHLGRIKEVFARHLELYSPEPIVDSRRLPEGLPPPLLWVPGLEPVYDPEELPTLSIPKRIRMDIFDGGDMYARAGPRRGILIGRYKDLNGWPRTLWKHPTTEEPVELTEDFTSGGEVSTAVLEQGESEQRRKM
ncbi:hypothetical protein N0V90_010970 [Kalmusia sp. IMI 367209]|nr:hypothetical protein N0V90_010970 [Kalmusia sp. IMI 367209]